MAIFEKVGHILSHLSLLLKRESGCSWGRERESKRGGERNRKGIFPHLLHSILSCDEESKEQNLRRKKLNRGP